MLFDALNTDCGIQNVEEHQKSMCAFGKARLARLPLNGIAGTKCGFRIHFVCVQTDRTCFCASYILNFLSIVCCLRTVISVPLTDFNRRCWLVLEQH
jgi:hypothetical protein